jgi:AcrR family transcriptional regulator
MTKRTLVRRPASRKGALKTVVPLRARILSAAKGLFYAHGLRAVGVQEIAEAAGTNKMTLYRYFESKDDLVIEFLHMMIADSDALWDEVVNSYPQARKALTTWLGLVTDLLEQTRGRGFVLARSIDDLPRSSRAARRVIEAYLQRLRDRIVTLSRAAGLRDPDQLGDQLLLLLQGAAWSLRSFDTRIIASPLIDMFDDLITLHAGSRRPRTEKRSRHLATKKRRHTRQPRGTNS